LEEGPVSLKEANDQNGWKTEWKREVEALTPITRRGGAERLTEVTVQFNFSLK
jgi:hypothetical protein